MRIAPGGGGAPGADGEPGGGAGVDAALASLGEFEARANAHARPSAARCATRAPRSRSTTPRATTTTTRSRRCSPSSADLREVWSALADVSRQLAKLAETPWAAVQPRKVRQALEKLLEDLRRLPARVRAYEAHDALSAQLKGRLARARRSTR